MTVKELMDALNEAVKHGVSPDSQIEVNAVGDDVIKSAKMVPGTDTQEPFFSIALSDDFNFGPMIPEHQV